MRSLDRRRKTNGNVSCLGATVSGSSHTELYPYVLALTVLACYWASLGCGIVYDDIAAIQNNPDLRPHRSIWRVFQNDFWGTPIHREQSHKSYRPLCVLTFRMNYALHGTSPFGYHAVNVLCHFLVCLLYYKTCILFVPQLAAAVAALLFAVHPVHTEAVTTITGRSELLSALFFLGTLNIYIRDTMNRGSLKLLICLCLTTAGFLCKEQSITVLGVWLVYDTFILLPKVSNTWKVNPVILKRILLLTIYGISIIFLRFHIMGGQLPSFSRFDNPASVARTPTRQLTYNYLIALNSWLLIFPSYLCCDWTMGTVPLVTSFSDVRNITTLIFYMVLLLFMWQAKRKLWHQPVLIMCLSLIILPFLPSTNLLFTVGFVVAERVLYLPSIGFCLLVAYGWHFIYMTVTRFYQKAVVLALVILMASHAIKTFQRNKDWDTEFTLYSSALKINQKNPKLFNNMGKTLEKMGQHNEALLHFQQAIRLEPNDIQGYLNSGRLLTRLKKFKEAEEVYVKAQSLLPKPHAPPKSKKVNVTPSQLQVFVELASLLSHNESRLEEADLLLKEVLKMRDDFTDAYVQRGEILLKLNRSKEAEAVYQRALQFDDSNANIYHNLGVLMMDQGKREEALTLFNTALKIDPDHQPALISSTMLIQELKMSKQAHIASKRLQKINYQGKESEYYYQNLGRLAIRNGDYSKGEEWFRRALELNPSSETSLFNLALLLSRMKRPSEALVILERLQKENSNHIKGLTLLGNIYYEMKDLTTAENYYRKILDIDPKNIQAANNLCVLTSEKGLLLQAEECFHTLFKNNPSLQLAQHPSDLHGNIFLNSASTR